MEVVSDTKADSGTMHGRVIIQGSIKCHVGLHGEHDRLGLGLLQLEQSLALRVASEVFPLLIKTEKYFKFFKLVSKETSKLTNLCYNKFS